MSLLNGARELATRSYQRSTPLHIFQAALPQPSYLQTSYPQNPYLEEPAKSIWENLVDFPARQKWAQEIQQEIAKLPQAQPGMEGMDSDEFRALESEARSRANRMSRKLDDAIVLATVVEVERMIQTIIQASLVDYRNLIKGLVGQPAPNPPPVSTMPPAQAQPPAVSDRELANRARNDFLKGVVDPTGDRRYKDLQEVEIRTFLTTLAESASNRATVVCVGQDGSLISFVTGLLADRLDSGTSFTGKEIPLNNYTGKLHRVEVESLVNLVGRSEAPKPAMMLKVIKETIAGMPEKSILLLDHLETIRGETKEMQDLRVEIAERDQVLVCGIYHAPPGEDLDKHLLEAQLGRASSIKTLPFRPYDKRRTVALLEDYFVKKVWRNQGRFSFARGAFDAVIDMQPGAWHDQKRKALPGLVIDLAQDAMDTASHGEAAVHDTASCALQWFRDLREKEYPYASPENQKKYGPILAKGEQEVQRLLSRPASRPDPNKPIEISSAHIVAELICRNVSEFHYPESKFDPPWARTRV